MSDARDVMREALKKARHCRRACYEVRSCECAQEVVNQLAALAEAGLEIRTRGSIEALEAEVAKVKASAKKFFADAGAITKNADQELEDMADALRITLDAKNAAEARAERLREALKVIAADPTNSAQAMVARKALEDDKQ